MEPCRGQEQLSPPICFLVACGRRKLEVAERDSALELGSRLHSCSAEIPGEGKGWSTQGTRKLYSRPAGHWDLDWF